MPRRVLLGPELVLAGGLLATGGCREPLTTYYELEREAPQAEWVFPPGVSVALSPTLDVHFGSGARADRAAEGRTSSSQLEVRAFLRGPIPADLAMTLTLFVEPEARGAALFVGGEKDPKSRLEPGRQGYDLPLTPGATGEVVELAAQPPRGSAPSLAAVRLVGAALVPAPRTIESGFEALAGEKDTSLTQVGPSVVRFALPLPEAAQLRFTPSLEASARPVRVWLTREGMGSPEREIWSSELQPDGRGTREAVVRLGTHPGYARIGLHVGGRPGDRVEVTWRTPRVLGRGPVHRLRPRAQQARERARADGLRARLADTNVLVVVLDAATALHFGCYGYPRATTLNMDRLAREGVLFERAYTPTPFTIGAVSSMWTSLYPDQHHAGARQRAPLPRERVTLAELLSARGVSTAAFAANPSAGPPFGLDRGFGEFHPLYGAGGFSPSGVWRAEEFRPVLREWLSRMRASRFFGYVHYREPHFPYDPPYPFDQLFGRPGPKPFPGRRDDGWVRRVNSGRHRPMAAEAADLVRLYDGNLAYVDREVGWLRDTLTELGLLETTTLVVTADHGESLLERGVIGHGGLLNEECIRVPLIVRFPGGRGPTGLRINDLVDLLDVAPTIADLFGALATAPARAYEGISLLPVVEGAPGKGVVLARTMQERPTYALDDGRWKLIHSLKTGRTELFDLAADPGERDDLFESEPLRTDLMRQELYRWLRDLHREQGSATEEQLTPAELEALRALGYVQSPEQ
jgi:arylsulfatase A-like enzyme